MFVTKSTIGILKEVSVGQHYFVIATLLRNSMLMNSILLNVEVWFSITTEEKNKFKTIDKLFIRKVLETPSSTPASALYLECGIIPIQFIILARRVMYLHYLLSLNEDDMLFKVFKAQLDDPLKNDWVLTVKESLQELEINLNFTEIKQMKNEKFKQIIKQKCKEAALKYLQNEKNKTERKMEKLKYNKLEMAKYLKPKKITINEKKCSLN